MNDIGENRAQPLWVVKIGGSLEQAQELRPWLNVLAQAGAGRVVASDNTPATGPPGVQRSLTPRPAVFATTAEAGVGVKVTFGVGVVVAVLVGVEVKVG